MPKGDVYCWQWLPPAIACVAVEMGTATPKLPYTSEICVPFGITFVVTAELLNVIWRSMWNVPSPMHRRQYLAGRYSPSR